MITIGSLSLFSLPFCLDPDKDVESDGLSDNLFLDLSFPSLETLGLVGVGGPGSSISGAPAVPETWFGFGNSVDRFELSRFLTDFGR